MKVWMIIKIVIMWAVAIGIVFVSFSTFWPLGDDYFYTFHRVVTSVYRGDLRIYMDNVNHNETGFYLGPWSILLLLPIGLLSPSGGMAYILTLSTLGILISIYAVMKEAGLWLRFLVAIFAVVNMYTLDLLTRGNIDGILVLGLGLAWLASEERIPPVLGVGLWLLSIKPLNVILPGLVITRRVWHWDKPEKLIAIAPLTASFIFSFPIFGINWPVRYVESFQQAPPLESPILALWRLPEPFNISRLAAYGIYVSIVIIFSYVVVKYRGPDQYLFALSLPMNLVFSPYAIASHYVLLIPAFAILVMASRLLLVVWLSTLVPILLIWAGTGSYWQNLLHPLVMLCVAAIILLRESNNAMFNE